MTRLSDKKFPLVWKKNGKQFVMGNSIESIVKFAKKGMDVKPSL